MRLISSRLLCDLFCKYAAFQAHCFVIYCASTPDFKYACLSVVSKPVQFKQRHCHTPACGMRYKKPCCLVVPIRCHLRGKYVLSLLHKAANIRRFMRSLPTHNLCWTCPPAPMEIALSDSSCCGDQGGLMRNFCQEKSCSRYEMEGGEGGNSAENQPTDRPRGSG